MHTLFQLPSAPNLKMAAAVPLYTAATALRIVLLLYGLWQDANSPLKYTDIDYNVFTDAARFVSQHHASPGGPYARETYRYTPLLAWMLLPTTWGSSSDHPWLAVALSSFGKMLFALADLVAGWLIVKVLLLSSARDPTVNAARARNFAAIWLLNPMVATISTRGSSEGLLAVLVMALLWAVLSKRTTLAGLLLGFGVHFKIYPFIYAPSLVWWMDKDNMSGEKTEEKGDNRGTKQKAPAVLAFFTAARLQLATVSLATFLGLNMAMYAVYGHDFLQHTYLHHVTRIDHRHNFSPYNILLYLTSAQSPLLSPADRVGIESLAFFPQLLLSCVVIPLVIAKKDLPTTMLVQTWTFVTFNKVCTSQVCMPPSLPRAVVPGPLFSISNYKESKD